MTDKVIDPAEVPVPQVDCDALEAAAADLKSDGTGVAQAGQDIKSSWQGLEGIYAAPESETLFAAIDPVATKGDDFDEAVTSVADALSTFAEEVRPIKARLQALKADAGDFQDEIAGDDDWREDEDKIGELDQLNNDILAAVHDYRRAERDCANAITSLFGGTTFVATGPGDEGSLGAGEEAHGFTEALEGVETPWITPQEHDAAWYVDVWDGVKDFGVGIAEDLGSMVGLYGEDGWGVSSWGEWGENLKNNWGETLNGLGSLVGLYGEEGWGVGSFGEWWGNFSSGWTEFAHAVVPWREWGDRPGYVITQTVLNVGSMFVGGAGVYKALATGARKVGGGNGDVDTNTGGDQALAPDTSGLQQIADRPGQSTTRDLQTRLDGLDIDAARIDGIADSLNEAEGFADRTGPVGGDTPGGPDPAFGTEPDVPQFQPAGGRAPDIQANADGPDAAPSTAPGTDAPDTGSPTPGTDTSGAPDRPTGPSQGPAGDGSGPGSGNPPGGGNGGDRPASPPSDGGRGDGAGDSPRPAGDAPETGDARPESRPTPPTESGQGSERPAGDSPAEHGEDGKPQEPEPAEGSDTQEPDGREGLGELGPNDAVESQAPREDAPDQDGQEPDTPPAVRPLPTDARSGHTLEHIDEFRVHRDGNGLIDEIDGRPAGHYIRDLMTERAEHMVDLAKNQEGPPSQAALGGRSSAVNALVLDRTTGLLAEGINGRSYEAIKPSDVHPLVEERVDRMREAGPFTQYNRHTGERMPDTEFPHNDHPLRHAEVKALNHLLHLRGEGADAATISEFRVDAMFTLWKQGPTPANCCANCTRIVDGASVSVDRNGSPPGTPGQEDTIIKGDL